MSYLIISQVKKNAEVYIIFIRKITISLYIRY